MLLPRNPSELRHHAYEALSEEERATQEDLCWRTCLDTEKSFLRAISKEGTFILHPPSAEDGLVKMDYVRPAQKNKHEALGDNALTANDLGWWEKMACVIPQNLGYCYNQTLAMSLIETLRRQQPSQTVTKLLIEAGFKAKLQRDTGEWVYLRKGHGDSLFTLTISGFDVRLTHTRKEETEPTALLRLFWASETLDGRWIPLFWPCSVVSPRISAVEMACLLASTWENEAMKNKDDCNEGNEWNNPCLHENMSEWDINSPKMVEAENL